MEQSSSARIRFDIVSEKFLRLNSQATEFPAIYDTISLFTMLFSLQMSPELQMQTNIFFWKVQKKKNKKFK